MSVFDMVGHPALAFLLAVVLCGKVQIEASGI